MRRMGMIVVMLLVAGGAADAETCLDKLNEAVTLADKLPPSAGRGAVLTDIARARDSRHEGDELGCIEQIDETIAMLREHLAQAAKPAAIQPDAK
jgi:hypothetical protein